MVDVAVRDLTVEYRSGDYTIRPIDDFDLDVPEGSLVLLLGPSGCGKTTLLSCLGGIQTPTSGSIRVGDVEVTELSGAALTEYRRHSVGIVFQTFNLVPSLTATQNVAAPLWAAGTPKGEARQRAAELLERVGLGDRGHHRPKNLSGGQQQRVGAARALALDPPLVLADEPTAHLDYIQVEGMLRLLRSFASGERIVVVSTHDHRLIPLADKVVEMVPDFLELNIAPETMSLKADEIIFEQGTEGERIYVIESGEIAIVRHLADGGEDLRVVLAAGDYFGEMSPLFGLPRSATAKARTDATVTAYTVQDFRDRMGETSMAEIVETTTGRAVPEAGLVAGPVVEPRATGP